MPGPKPHVETEIKLRLADAASGRKLLAGAGFRLTRRRVLETNLLFDTPDRELLNQRRLIRLRWAGGRCLLTYKGPPVSGPHKQREEIEVVVSDWSAMEAILKQLGLQPAYRYEKYRSEYQRPKEPGLVTLDETPVGTFLELEGSPAWIDETADRLGFRKKDYITKSYGRLWAEERGERETGEGMLFDGSTDHL
jgi:adenylate cyclase class 2